MHRDVPNIDKMAGIKLYSTRFEGIGGSIKLKNEDFKVLELLVDSISNDISSFPINHTDFQYFYYTKMGWIRITPLLRYPTSWEQESKYLESRILKQILHNTLHLRAKNLEKARQPTPI